MEILPADDSPVPDPRTDAVFLLLGDVIFLHGEMGRLMVLLHGS